MDREPSCDNAFTFEIQILYFYFYFHYVRDSAFVQFFHAFSYIFCRAFSYISTMRFHHQLMRFIKRPPDHQIIALF